MNEKKVLLWDEDMPQDPKELRIFNQTGDDVIRISVRSKNMVLGRDVDAIRDLYPGDGMFVYGGGNVYIWWARKRKGIFKKILKRIAGKS